MAGKTSGSQDMVMTYGGPEIHPKGLLEAISFIDINFAQEMGGCIPPSRFLSTQQRIEFMEVGFRSSFVSGLVVALLVPLSIGVIEKYIPIFGSAETNLMNDASAMLLALSFSIGYSLFIAKSSQSYKGEFTRSMVRNLLGGMIFGSILKAVVAFIAYHGLYLFVFSNKNLLWMAAQMTQAHVRSSTAITFFMWAQGFRSIFLTSAYFVVFSTMIFILIPVLSYFWASYRNNKLVAFGMIKKEVT